ncbi:outer membrane lipoprotein-sorting protein [Sunxiuqinia elliptica]|uniref:Outer membrane lipoprotein-sorting protein n=1 Tax=Sunxiuqinia elliptica TaxID=655355 RepID=A0A4R6GNH6_9BACT|nr:outer membrane lipoprotein-sorting protein [Sunxiuqinia elliptica]TDN96676.1 outer membrane lipoprotein-sorting protein [Sunxiuqinia elliptica]TDO55765.1 outer membrane lipoprotein-sorting protein [Sunxiuqinia elliptica]
MKTLINLIALTFLSLASTAQTTDIKEIVKKADEKLRGTSSIGEVTMTIQRPSWERTLSMKNWTLGTEYSLILITAPAKEKGQVFLKRESEMWNWLPSIDRMIKIPPSMMMQSWMGSDFTNDDLVKESSIVKDYTHKLIGKETIENYPCYKVELIPLEDAPVVWGKIYMWISQKEFLWLKAEFFDEDGFLVNTEILTDVKKMDDRIIPTRMEMIPADKEGHKTIMTFDNIDFEVPIKDSFFSIQNMKRIR